MHWRKTTGICFVNPSSLCSEEDVRLLREAVAWYSFPFIRQYYSMVGTMPAWVWLGNLGMNPRTGQSVGGVIIRHIKEEEAEKEACGFHSQ